jgi:hypothetical protein
MAKKFLPLISVWKILNEKPTTARLNGIAGIAGTVALWTSTYSLGSDWNTMNFIGFVASWAGLIGILFLLTSWIENQTSSKLAVNTAVYSASLIYSAAVVLSAIIAINIFAP